MTLVSIDELLGQSDFISLHPALNDETRHMISTRQFALMKRTAFLINTSRGPIIDEPALARALAEGRIAGAGIDVYENEPKIERALLTMDNVVLTPHLGSAVMELREKHGACRGRQHRRDRRRHGAAELHQSGGVRAGGVTATTPPAKREPAFCAGSPLRGTATPPSSRHRPAATRRSSAPTASDARNTIAPIRSST